MLHISFLLKTLAGPSSMFVCPCICMLVKITMELCICIFPGRRLFEQEPRARSGENLSLF
jgi:hypothetical protein